MRHRQVRRDVRRALAEVPVDVRAGGVVLLEPPAQRRVSKVDDETAARRALRLRLAHPEVDVHHGQVGVHRDPRGPRGRVLRVLVVLVGPRLLEAVATEHLRRPRGTLARTGHVSPGHVRAPLYISFVMLHTKQTGEYGNDGTARAAGLRHLLEQLVRDAEEGGVHHPVAHLFEEPYMS